MSLRCDGCQTIIRGNPWRVRREPGYPDDHFRDHDWCSLDCAAADVKSKSNGDRPLHTEDWLRAQLVAFEAAVDEQYDNPITRIFKKDGGRYFAQWVLTGTFADDEPGWEPTLGMDPAGDALDLTAAEQRGGGVARTGGGRRDGGSGR